MEDNKSDFNKLKLKFYEMKRSTKIIIIIFIIVISSLTFLIFKNHIFKEQNSYLAEDNAQVLDEDLTAAESAADLRKEITEQQMKSSDLDLSEKIAAIEEIRDPFFPSQSKGDHSSAGEGSLIYSESELKVNNEDKNYENDNNKEENNIKEIYHLKKSGEAGDRESEKDENSRDSEKAQAAAQNESESSNPEKRIVEIEIPFSLLGIITDKSSAAALFSYNGKVIKKSEGGNIENFQIEKIKKEVVVLAYDDFKYNQYIWRHDEIEEK